jgi:hypothetical protein
MNQPEINMTLFLRKSACAFLVTLVLVISLPSLSFAADAVKTQAPDPAANPVLAGIIKLGSKLYYLGNKSGLDGWLIVKDGQVQIAYATPGSQNAMIGAMFGPSGENVSADQVQALLTTNKELNTLLTNSMNPGQAAPGTVADPNMAMAQNQAAVSAAPNPAVLLPPGERLMKDLLNAAGVSIGNGAAPLLLMVMDPDCPHCQATWRALRDTVLKNNLQIRLIPLGAQTEHERAAAQLLHVADPLTVWDKYVGGDKSQLAGTPDATLIAAIRANGALVDSWHIDVTPYLVYRAKDGKVKFIKGEPDQVTAITGDIQ